MITAGPGQCYIAPNPNPRCPTHGQMHWQQPQPGPDQVWPPGRWICHGFDGEGCPHEVSEADMGWSLIGTTDSPLHFDLA